MADELADASDVDPDLFEQMSELGSLFSTREGVVVMPVTFDDEPHYVLCDVAEDRTAVYALVVDEDLLARLKPRDAPAIRIARRFTQ